MNASTQILEAATGDDCADRCTIGVDFGSLSGRAVVVRVSDGAELASAVYDYPPAVMDTTLAATGAGLPPEWALQDPEDYIGVLKHAVPQAVRDAGIDPSAVVGVGTDFVACTMVPTLADGTPLSALAELRSRPHAYVKLWKHHAAQPQADRINATARERREPWLARYGDLISSEWEFAKGLQIFEEDRDIYHRVQCWVEGADWIVWQLCGRYVRNACTAGYKAILQDGGYPSRDFLEALAVGFGSFVDDKVAQPIGELGDRAGELAARAAEWTGLPAGIAVAVGNVDDRLNPTGEREAHGTAYDLRDGRLIADLDHHNYLQVFTTRRYPNKGQLCTAVAVEPMTVPADAFNSGTGLKWLAPQDSWSASWAIQYHDGADSPKGGPVAH